MGEDRSQFGVVKNMQSPAKSETSKSGHSGLARIVSACGNTARGIRDGLSSEDAIRQEVAVAILAIPLSLVIADNLWVWVALMASLMLVLAVEFLNTAIEQLCDHVMPERHEQIRVTKDLASAGVFFTLALAVLVWGAAAWNRAGY